MLPIAIQSRMITGVFFDPADGRLQLRMANGQSRSFEDVPAEAVHRLVEARSPGRHYLDQFRHQHRRAG